MSTAMTFQPFGTAPITTKGLERIADIDPRLTRTNYFDGRLLTAEDLTRDQIYLDQRLRDVGQILGYGIVRGLDLAFDRLAGHLTLSPGIGVTSAGRVLELTTTLTIDLGDRALITTLNNGAGKRLERGLYAVVLQYTEAGADIAEVFPTDLTQRQSPKADVIAEAVQLGIVKLPLPLAQQPEVQIRANLIRLFLGDPTAHGAVPEDSIALGVLAISSDRPLWLDPLLLRQPLRSIPQAGDLQQDLARHYDSLFRDVISERRSGSLGEDFAAANYFRFLPPAGRLPKATIDPVTGRQSFFPESYNVWIAPVRRSDLQLIVRESLLLPPIDLTLDEPCDVVVVAPLSNTDYGRYALRLERDTTAVNRRLPQLDLLRLRLYPRPPVHVIDTDAATWQSIWDTVPADDVLFLRRPLRAAETGISGIVLALGTTMPAGPGPDTSPSDGDTLLEDEDTVFLGRVNFNRLSQLRPPADADGTAAVNALSHDFGNQAPAVQAGLDILLRIPRKYDPVLWQTLLALARQNVLPEFRLRLIDGQDAGTPTGNVVAAAGATYGLDQALLNRWTQLDNA